MPEVAARAHLRWMMPVLERGRARRAGWTTGTSVEAIAVTDGPGLAGSLLVGLTMAKTLAWLHDRPLVPVNHLEGHIYAAWLLDPRQDEPAAPVFPLVALVVSGGHTFLVEMADHLTLPPPRPDRRRRGGRGVRQGRPSARPARTPAARPSSAPRPGPCATTATSRAPGSARATTSASAASRRPCGGPSRRPLGRHRPTTASRSRRTSWRSWPGPSRSRSWTSWRPRPRGRPARPARPPSSWAAASPPTRCCATACATRRPTWASPW